MKKILCCLLALIVLAGCSGKENEDVDNKTAEAGTMSAADFVFTDDGVQLQLNDPFNPSKISKEYDYYESESCGYDGMDKIYTYENFEVYTYPYDGKDLILEIDLLDGAKTSKNIELGSTLEELTTACGEPDEQRAGNYVYVSGNCELIFVISSDTVTGIQYFYIAE